MVETIHDQLVNSTQIKRIVYNNADAVYCQLKIGWQLYEEPSEAKQKTFVTNTKLPLFSPGLWLESSPISGLSSDSEPSATSLEWIGQSISRRTTSRSSTLKKMLLNLIENLVCWNRCGSSCFESIRELDRWADERWWRLSRSWEPTSNLWVNNDSSRKRNAPEEEEDTKQ